MANAKNNATLGGTVWNDLNKDGLQNDGNIGIAGVKVLLLNEDNKPTGKYAISDANGNYSFAGLKPGEYSIKFDVSTLPADAIFTLKGVGHNNAIDSDANVVTGKTGPVELHARETNMSLDAGVVLPRATIGDRVWFDANKNGIQDNGELGVAGQHIVLLNNQNQMVAETTSDSNGAYAFSVDPGTYKLSFSNLRGDGHDSLTLKNQGGNVSLDSDVDPTTHETAWITVKAGETNNTIDAGYITDQVVIGGSDAKVWYDVNRDGIRTSDEAVIPGVTVKLTSTDGIVNLTTTTDETGSYQFPSVDKVGHTYHLQFINTDDTKEFTRPNATPARGVYIRSDNSDADINTGITNDVSTFNPTMYSAGLRDKLASSSFLGPGNKVWNDIASPSTQGANEPGVAGVTVQLVQAGDDTEFRTSDDIVVKTTVTDANGIYGFTDIPSGLYQVLFSNIGEGYQFTSSDFGQAPYGFSLDKIDSDVNPSGYTSTLDLTRGEIVEYIAAGIVAVTPPVGIVGTSTALLDGLVA